LCSRQGSAAEQAHHVRCRRRTSHPRDRCGELAAGAVCVSVRRRRRRRRQQTFASRAVPGFSATESAQSGIHPHTTHPHTEHTHTHARTHERTHSRMHAHMHARMHACMHARTHAHTHTRTHACMHACMHARMHECMHTVRTRTHAIKQSRPVERVSVHHLRGRWHDAHGAHQTGGR